MRYSFLARCGLRNYERANVLKKGCFPKARVPVGFLPPRLNEGPKVPVNFKCPKEVLEKIDKIAGENDDYDRTAVIMHFIRWGIAAYEDEKVAKKGGSKK